MKKLIFNGGPCDWSKKLGVHRYLFSILSEIDHMVQPGEAELVITRGNENQFSFQNIRVVPLRTPANAVLQKFVWPLWSFPRYMKDGWRASQIRNMGKVSGNSTLSDNDWEQVKYKSVSEIKKWIDEQMAMRSCIVVLVGKTTSTRQWVRYEIQKAYESNKGIVGIYIHGLKDKDGKQTEKGRNPFDMVLTKGGESLSKYVICYDPPYSKSSSVYSDIEDKLAGLIENALKNKAP